MAITRDLDNLVLDINNAKAGFFNTFIFGHLGEVNQSHNTNYPLIVLTPPTSTWGDVYKNDEEMTLRFVCYKAETRNAELSPPQYTNATLAQAFDDLLDAFKGTIQALVASNEHKYVLADGWNVERIMDAQNDRLVGLDITIRIDKFRFCLSY